MSGCPVRQPSVQVDRADDELNVSSTAYIPGDTVASLLFTAPRSGRALFHLYLAGNSTGTDQLLLSFEVYRGNDATGVLVLAADDNRAIRLANVASIQRTGISYMASGLTPLATHFARTMHRVTGGSTVDVFHRRLIAVPTA